MIKFCFSFILVMAFVQVYSQGEFFKTGIAVPFSNRSVVLKPSWIKEREDLNTTWLKSIDPDRLLHNFRVNAGLPSDAKPLEGWEAPHIGLKGHFTGHYLSAVSMLAGKYDDPLLAERLNYLVEELNKCQQALPHRSHSLV